MKQVGLLSSAEGGTLVKVEICMNAAEKYMPPMFVFPKKKKISLNGWNTPRFVCM